MSFKSWFLKIRAVLGGIVIGPPIYFVCQHYLPDLRLPKGFMPRTLEIFLVGLLKLLVLPATTLFGIKGISYLDILYWAAIVWFFIWANDIRPPKKGDGNPNPKYRIRPS